MWQVDSLVESKIGTTEISTDIFAKNASSSGGDASRVGASTNVFKNALKIANKH